MRVGLVIYGSLDTVSGGYLYDRQLVAHLRAQGDEVEIISLPWRAYPGRLLDNVAAGLGRRLQAGRWDVLLQDELNHPSLFALNRWLRPRVPYPILSIVHHLRSSERHAAWPMALYRRVERAYLRGVDGFIFNSRTTREAVEALTPLPVRRGERREVVACPAADHIGPGLDRDQIEARAARPGPLRVLFVGNVIPRKGLHTLLAALARLEGGWRLTVAGSLAVDPAYGRSIRARIAQQRLEDRVALLGRLDDAGLRAQLAAHDVLAVPSSYEGFGIAYLEAMAFGLPVIATTAGGAGEIVTHGQDGWLAPPDDPDALAGALRALGSDRARLRAMSRAARARYDRHPTWAESMARVRAFLLSRTAALARV